MTEYTIAAIPTHYNSVRFRSRLEARWAVLFDIIGWGWEYEPFDLDQWVPDFCINIGDDVPMLVEVKPYFDIRQFRRDPNCKPAWDIFDSYEHRVGFFGNSPKMTHWFYSNDSGGGDLSIDRCGVGDSELLDDLWKECGNIVQYKGFSSIERVTDLKKIYSSFKHYHTEQVWSDIGFVEWKNRMILAKMFNPNAF